ncbi:MAG: hypothetical protein AAGD35_22695 [Actinomycetota bacterium]
MGMTESTISGRLMGVTGKAEVAGVEVWFAYRSVDGEETNLSTRTDASGAFAFDVPSEPLERARIGANVEGVTPVDLQPAGRPLQPGDLVLMIDDIVPSFLRYGG